VWWFFYFSVVFLNTFDSVVKYRFRTKKLGRREGFILIEAKGLGVFLAEMKNLKNNFAWH